VMSNDEIVGDGCDVHAFEGTARPRGAVARDGAAAG
jgi:hypothetical protein